MMQHLPALQVLIPLICAPLVFLMHNARLGWLLSVIAGVLGLIVSLLLLDQVQTLGVIRYNLGGWEMPLGIEYRVDIFSAFVMVIITFTFLLVTCGALRSIEKEVSEDRVYIFYAAWLLNYCGLLGMLVTGDIFNLFVFIEISSLASYTLIALGQNRMALLASFRYLIQGTIGATFILIGVGLMYAMTGTLNMQDLAERLPAVADSRAIQAAFAFFVIGAALKLALFPLHHWLPDAYAHAPSMVSAFLSASSTKVFAYVLFRGMYSIFGLSFLENHEYIGLFLIIFSMLAAFIGSAIAIFQDNIKRLLAWSSVAQIGYIMVGASMLTVSGLAASILHIFNHALIKCTLFVATACIVYRTGSVCIRDMRGLGHRMPWTMGAFTLSALSLIGVPLTAGFITKWYLIRAALESGYWPVAVLILMTSLMAIIYLVRVLEAVWIQDAQEADGASQSKNEAPLSMLLPLWVLVLANLYFGIDAGFTGGSAEAAAQNLFALSP